MISGGQGQKWTKKHHRSSPYVSCTIFHFFWNRTMALCAEQTQMSVEIHWNLPNHLNSHMLWQDVPLAVQRHNKTSTNFKALLQGALESLILIGQLCHSAVIETGASFMSCHKLNGKWLQRNSVFVLLLGWLFCIL